MRFEEASGTPDYLAELEYNDQTWDRPWNQSRGQLTSCERMPSYIFDPVGPAHELPRGERLDSDTVTLRDQLSGKTLPLDDFLNRRTYSDALLIARDSLVIYEKYFNGMTEHDQHLCHSCTKTLTTMHIGIAIADGLLDPQRRVDEFIPELRHIDAWRGITVQHLLDMSTGIRSDEHYENPESMYYEYARGVGYWGPESGLGVLQFVVDNVTEKECDPGTRFNYASYNTNMFPLILEAVYGTPAAQLYEESLYRRIGAEFPAILNADAYQRPIVEGQLNLSLRDFYRWGHLLANNGQNLIGEQVIPASWVDECFRPDEARRKAFAASDYAELFPHAEYHNQLWVLDPEKQIAVMLGIYGQFFYIDKTNNLEIVGFSSHPELTSPHMASHLKELWRGITEALR
jgi:CubicO group peptidase (beta-lactamase class C family)